MQDPALIHATTLNETMRALTDTTHNRLTATVLGDTVYQEKVTELNEALRSVIAEYRKSEALLAFVGEMSGGKSTIINMIVGYPLFPSAKIATSEAPVEIRYGEKPTLEIITYGDAGEESVYYFDDFAQYAPRNDPENRLKRLVQYACWITKKRLITCDNLQYYFNGFDALSDEQALSQTSDVYRAIQIMMIALSASVGRGIPSLENEPAYREAIGKQVALLKSVFGVDEDLPYAVRVSLPSPILRSGLVLVDLPGLGSGNPLHEKITRKYMGRADAYILPFLPVLRAEEAIEALNIIAKYDKMSQAGKDSRFIVTINQCDTIQPITSREAYIQQAVQQIRPLLKGIEIPVIYPISAWFAEYRLIENGVPGANTNVGKNYVAQMQQFFSGRPVSEQEVTDWVKRQYETPFEYTDPQTGKRVSSSTRDFMENVIGAYAPRIRFMNALKQLMDVMAKYREFSADLSAQLGMLQVLRDCGDSLMDNLLDKMAAAMRDSSRVFTQVTDAINESMRRNQQALTKDMDNTVCSYEAGFAQADTAMRLHLDTAVARFTRDAFGHVVIDTASPNKTLVEHNRTLFYELIQYFESFDFDPFLAGCSDMLEKSLLKERKLYDSGIEDANKAFAAFIDNCRLTFQEAYAAFREEIRDQVPAHAIALYKKSFDLACDGIVNYLTQLGREGIQHMHTVGDAEFDLLQRRVTTEMAAAIIRVKNFYHKQCAEYMKSKVKESLILSRNFVDINEIRREIGKHFRTAVQNHNDLAMLDDIITKGSDCHVQRVNRFLVEWQGKTSSFLTQSIEVYFPRVEKQIRLPFRGAGGDIRASFATAKSLVVTIKTALEQALQAAPTQESFTYGKANAYSRDAAEETLRCAEDAAACFDQVIATADAFLAENREEGAEPLGGNA